jgi:hypothetical protein
VALRVVEVLQPVLEVAQKDIRVGEVALCLRRKQAFCRQHFQRLEGRPYPQLRVAAAAHELQRLHDELDLADAAGAELDVLGELAPGDVAAHLRVQRAQRAERAVVEVLAEHERPHD